MAYAERTKVDASASRDEIERMLERRGASSFLTGTRDNKIFIAFETHDLKIRIQIEKPVSGDFPSTQTGQKQYEQAIKQRWRALLLSIKAKLVSIEEGIETFEQAFLAHIVTNDQQTIGERLIPRLKEATAEAEIKLLTA